MCVFVYINVYTKYIIYNIYNLKIYNIKFINQKAVFIMCVCVINQKVLIEAIRNKLGNSEVNVNGIWNVTEIKQGHSHQAYIVFLK